MYRIDPNTGRKTPDTPIKLKGPLPGEGAEKGSNINAPVIANDGENKRQIILLEKLAEGGEGSVFSTNVLNHVAKIYHRDKLTANLEKKVRALLPLTSKIDDTEICLPVALLYNSQQEFIGFLMPRAKGFELGKSVFQPQLLLKKFPSWNKKSTIQLCLTILHKIDLLNRNGIILGDINPANILVVSPNEVCFVDCDSYQVAEYPCPVGTAHFTAPEAAGKNFGEFLRTQEMENFAIATLLFMIMLPGKPPYSAVGGTTPQKNIANGDFPYPHMGNDVDNTPAGMWGFIWSHMSYKMRLAFYETFKKGEKHFAPKDRMSASEWIAELENYQYAIDNMAEKDEMALAIFPTRLKKKECKSCGTYYVPDPQKYSPLCPECRAKLQAHRSATGVAAHRPTASPTSGKHRCAFCGELKANPGHEFCLDCRDKVVEQRKCVNCLKEFPVTVSLKSWENRSGYKQNQCPTCKDAHCVGSPCKHAEKQVASPSAAKKTAKGTTAAKPFNASKPSNSTKPSNDRWWWIYNPFVWALVIFFILIIGSCVSHSPSPSSTTSNANGKQAQKMEAAMDLNEAMDLYKQQHSESQEIDYGSFRAICEQKITELSPSTSQGDIMTFGTYPEAADGTPAPLLWQVHAIEDGYATLISLFAIDAQPYDNLEYQETTDYSLSSLSYWLDSNFRTTAFTEEEESRLLPYGCAGAICKVGLMENSLSDGVWMFTYPTPYAIAQGVMNARNTTLDGSSFTGGCDYWIASENNSAEASYVAGDVSDGRTEPCNHTEGVVPVIKVVLAS